MRDLQHLPSHVHTPSRHSEIGSSLDILQMHIWSGLTEKEGIRLCRRGVVVEASTKDATFTVRGPR